MSVHTLNRRKLVLTSSAVAATTLLWSAHHSAMAQEGVTILTTIGQIKDVVQNVIGDLGSVDALMGPGIDPHLYKPSAGDVSKLEGANVIFYGGLHLEGRMTETLEHLARGDREVVAVSETIEEDRILKDEDGAVDPHLWFDVLLWHDAVASIPSTLAEFDPVNAATYEANWTNYSTLLHELDRYVEEQIQRIPEQRRVLVTAHDAFNYFGHRYGFEVRGIQGMSTGSEASAGDIQDLADFLAENEIPAIFIESSVPASSIEALQKACESRGWQVNIGGELFSDAMGNDGTLEGTYEGMIRHNVDMIVAALAEN